MHKKLNVNSCKFYNSPLGPFETGYSQAKKATTQAHSFSSFYYNENPRNEIDSLIGVRNTTQDQDYKIRTIESESPYVVKEDFKLQSGNSYNDSNARHGYYGNAVSGIKQVHKSYEKNISFSAGQVDVNLEYEMEKKLKADHHSDKNEFTKWLDSTIDSFDRTDNSRYNRGTYIPTAKTVIINPDYRDARDCIITDYEARKNFEIDRAGRELLFESFLIRKYPRYTPIDDQEILLQPVNLSKRKHEKTEKSSDWGAKKTKTSDKNQEENKAKTLRVYESSDIEVEVINIDDDFNCSPQVNNKLDLKEDKPNVLEKNEKTSVKEETLMENSFSKKRVWECPICFEQNTGQAVVTTMCGHVFCKKCLDDYYVTYSPSCPTCRTDLHDKPVITLFNF